MKLVRYERRGSVRLLGNVVESCATFGNAGAGSGAAKETEGQYGREWTKGHENDPTRE